jgi:hypothetical protein
MKHIKPYNKFLLEAVLNIDDSLIDKLKSYQERNIPEIWKKIANFILEFIGKDSLKNRFDLISPDYQNIKNFLVQSGRQKNSQSVSKVIRSILVSYGVDFDKYGIKDDTIQKFSHDLIEEINYIEYSDDDILEIKDIFQELADEWNIEWVDEIDWSEIEDNDFLYSFHMKTPGRNNPNYHYNVLVNIILPDRMNTDFTVWENIDQFVSDISDIVERLKNMGYNNAQWNKLLWEGEGHIQVWF